MSTSNRSLPTTPVGWMVFAWGVGGVFLIIANPVFRLAGVALEAFQHPLTPLHWGALGLWMVFMGYAEGWRGFHGQFSPRVVVRSLELAHRPVGLASLLAPLTAMGLIYATRKRRIVSRSLLVGIILIVFLVRQLEQPWRGLIDAGVVFGLGIGLVSILYWLGMALAGQPSDMPSDFE